MTNVYARWNRDTCTCAGGVPGWPQHESFCGQPDPGGPYFLDPSILETPQGRSMTQAMTPKEMFDRDTSEHVMTILHDDGVYRHVRFAQPGTSIMHWDLITWPGHLCIDGDLESFTFSREHDMFGFFAMDRGRINPQYWAEKITNRSVQTRVYESDTAKARIVEAFLEQRHWMSDPASPAWRSLREEVLDEFTLGDESLIRDALARWSFTDVGSCEVWEFSDTWEWDLREWDYHYLVACHAIAWGIAKYREAKLAVAA